MGKNALASGANSTALGVNAAATAANSIALGANSVASEPDTVSVGTDAPGGQRRITNVAAGHEQYDAVNYGQFSGAIAATAAAPSIVTPSQPGKTAFSANTAYYQGTMGIGIGIAHRLNIMPSATLNATVSEAQGNQYVARAGFSFEF
jgi:autotransporter adhesin